MAKNLTVVNIKRLFKAIARTTSEDGAAFDLAPYITNHDFGAVLELGTATGTAISVAVKIQESTTTTAGDFTDISGATFATVTGTTSEQRINFKPANPASRYVRAVATYGTNMTSATFTVQLVLAKRLT